MSKKSKKSKPQTTKYNPTLDFQNTSNNPPPEFVTSSDSLIRYDTPFLVSATISNKKLLAELDENNEMSELFLKNIINGINISDYSLKDALNKILPPKKLKTGEQMWVQYVSCNPVTKAEVINLYDGLRDHLKNENARMFGLCPIRERLYDETFYELIRQITINCLERGILLMRIKKELIMTVETYQNLYESALAYGIRVILLAEDDKKNLQKEIEDDENEINQLENDIEEIEFALKEHKERDIKEREEMKNAHKLEMEERLKKIKILKDSLKDKLNFHSK